MECVPYPSALEVYSRQGTIQIHVYLYLTLQTCSPVSQLGHRASYYSQCLLPNTGTQLYYL